jgi:heme-degrading monooxygenase HmoA
MKIAKTPSPPYYAAIATTIRISIEDGYNEMAYAMEEFVIQQPSYLGHEFARDGIGINVSYWETIEDIKKWKYLEEHLVAKIQCILNYIGIDEIYYFNIDSTSNEKKAIKKIENLKESIINFLNQ